MVNSYYIPNKEYYPVVRNDYQCIDHVSFLLSKESTKTLSDILDSNGIEHGLKHVMGDDEHPTVVYATTGITIAYSKDRIKSPLFGFHLDCITRIFSLDEIIKVDSSQCYFHRMPDNKGQMMDVLVVMDDVFTSEHNNFFIKGAEWSLGNYIPFITINKESIYPKPIEIKLPDTLVLTFDRIRYMRFGELIED